MATKSLQSPGIGPIAMAGAGFCAAVLFTILRQGTLPALALSQLTPLPIMISVLGFGPLIGFGSVLLATLTVAVLATVHEGNFSSTAIITGLITGMIFAIIQGLPAWWLGFVSSLARPDDASRWRIPPLGKSATPFTYYPVGDILVHAGVIVICLVCLLSAIVAVGYGGFDAAIDHLTAQLLPLVQKVIEAQPELRSFNVESVTYLAVKVTPAVMAGWYLTVFLANLWLAGRVTQTSNRLRRPWPNIALDLILPRPLALALAAAVGLCFVKSWPGTIGLIAAVTLGLIYALQGLAVAHCLSRGSKWRGLILSCIYAALILFIPWPLALFAILGLADMAFSFRRRKAAAPLVSKP